jgi:hypothetical protein
MARSAYSLALLAVCLSAAPATAQTKNTHLGVKGTVLLPGEAYIAECDCYFDIDMSFGAGGMIDTKLGEKFTGGLFLDLLNVSAYDETGMMFDFGVALKALLGGEAGKPSWRPGIGFGYGTLSAVGSLATSKYLTLRAGVEMVLPSNWLAEATVYAAPTGGNDDVTVTYGPLLMVRFGRVF